MRLWGTAGGRLVTEPSELTLEFVPLDQLAPLPGNPRRGNVAAVVRSYERFGQRRPIVARHLPDGSAQVTAGNTQLEAARRLGWPTILVAWHEDADDVARAWALADNRTSDLGTYDEAALLEMLGDVRPDAALFEATGYTEADLARLTGHERRRSVDVDPDAAPEPPTEPVTQPGDVWHLGPHVLGCFDSLVGPELGQLLGDRPADMAFCDPPYAIYGSASGVSAEVADDKMVRPFFRSVLMRLGGTLKIFGHAYVCCDWRSWASWWEVARGSHLAPKNMVVWDKGASGLGGMFANTHELLFFASRQPSKSKTMTSGKVVGERMVSAPNMWRVDRVAGGSGRLHNAQKPVGLVERAIGYSSDEGEVVLDLFAGSGSTLIAADGLARRAVLVDVDPRWCDVTCRRWQTYSDVPPVLERTGQPVDFCS